MSVEASEVTKKNTGECRSLRSLETKTPASVEASEVTKKKTPVGVEAFEVTKNNMKTIQNPTQTDSVFARIKDYEGVEAPEV